MRLRQGGAVILARRDSSTLVMRPSACSSARILRSMESSLWCSKDVPEIIFRCALYSHSLVGAIIFLQPLPDWASRNVAGSGLRERVATSGLDRGIWALDLCH